MTAGSLAGELTISAYTQDGGFISKSEIIVEPDWMSIPGKVEAENFIEQMGVQTENCSDIGRGLNVGYVDNGDWMQYAINNATDLSDFEASFRLASPSAGGSIIIYLDSVMIAQVDCPYTGGWQNWKSVSTNLNINKGTHYLKLFALKGGFNLNYIDFSPTTSMPLLQVQNDPIIVYPMPASEILTIQSGNWKFNQLNIINMIGKIVYSAEFGFQTDIILPIKIIPGVYILQLGGLDKTISKRIIVKD